MIWNSPPKCLFGRRGVNATTLMRSFRRTPLTHSRNQFSTLYHADSLTQSKRRYSRWPKLAFFCSVLYVKIRVDSVPNEFTWLTSSTWIMQNCLSWTQVEWFTSIHVHVPSYDSFYVWQTGSDSSNPKRRHDALDIEYVVLVFCIEKLCYPKIQLHTFIHGKTNCFYTTTERRSLCSWHFQ